MSALYSIVYPECIKMLTDGAVYRNDGTIVDLRRKVFTASHMPIAVTGVGHMGFIQTTAETLTSEAFAPTFDEAVERFAVVVRTLRHGLENRLMKASFLIAGYSDSSQAFRQFAVHIHDYWPQIEPCTIQDAGPEYGFGPTPSIEDFEEGGFRADFERLGFRFMDERGADFMETMRQKPERPAYLADGDPIHAVGGQCDLTTVTRERAITETLRTWPDRIGQKIDPLAAKVISIASRRAVA